MKITAIRDWIEGFSSINARWGTGYLASNTKEQIILFGGQAFTNPTAIGLDSSYIGKGVRILVQWNESNEDTEETAQTLYDELKTRPSATIGGEKVYAWLFRDAGPQLIGLNASGYFEYVIDIELIIGD